MIRKHGSKERKNIVIFRKMRGYPFENEEHEKTLTKIDPSYDNHRWSYCIINDVVFHSILANSTQIFLKLAENLREKMCTLFSTILRMKT